MPPIMILLELRASSTKFSNLCISASSFRPVLSSPLVDNLDACDLRIREALKKSFTDSITISEKRSFIEFSRRSGSLLIPPGCRLKLMIVMTSVIGSSAAELRDRSFWSMKFGMLDVDQLRGPMIGIEANETYCRTRSRSCRSVLMAVSASEISAVAGYALKSRASVSSHCRYPPGPVIC